MSKGGRGGKIHEGSSGWNYFPRESLGFLAKEERRKHNENVFKDISEQCDDNIDPNIHETRIDNECTYQIINVSKLEELVNRTCVMKCDLNCFLEYCLHLNNQLTVRKMVELKEE